MSTAKGRPSRSVTVATDDKIEQNIKQYIPCSGERQPASGTARDRQRSIRYRWRDGGGLNPDKSTRSHALNNDLCCKRWSGCSRP
ncbi:hypothetical protein V6N13_093178 [Hibiscus sabdariffa]|uniref:Uncharacterized protein n=1 Tax=Hibiscus sabdariffa TaxID=183260 RepID=A0ABR2C9G8_9ROSI